VVTVTTALTILIVANLVMIAIKGVIQQRINKAHQRSIDAHLEAITAINKTIANHQRTLDTLRGIRSPR
jgi:predicted phage tail protein